MGDGEPHRSHVVGIPREPVNAGVGDEPAVGDRFGVAVVHGAQVVGRRWSPGGEGCEHPIGGVAQFARPPPLVRVGHGHVRGCEQSQPLAPCEQHRRLSEHVGFGRVDVFVVRGPVDGVREVETQGLTPQVDGFRKRCRSP